MKIIGKKSDSYIVSLKFDELQVICNDVETNIDLSTFNIDEERTIAEDFKRLNKIAKLKEKLTTLSADLSKISTDCSNYAGEL